ncbi:MAG: oleate hydratase [Lachnospira eligens]
MDALILHFLDSLVETPRDTIFTTEYSVRTAMEADMDCLA